MNYKTVSAKAPGKLFLCGEYAVLTAGQPAIIMAIDQYLTCSITPNHITTLTTDLPNVAPLILSEDNKVIPNEWHYAVNAIQIVEQYLTEQQITLTNYNIVYQSQLQSNNGIKYGLGSSGAVVVSTVKALLLFYNIQYTPLMLYKLCVLACLQMNAKGSFADIATMCYGGIVYYQSVDRQWLNAQQPHYSISKMLQQPWQSLHIECLPIPPSLVFAIGWTQSPASTDEYITNTQKRVTATDFLTQSATIVNNTKHAICTQNISSLQTSISQSRHLLNDYAKTHHITIETTALTHLCDIAQHHHFVAKSSGAGGGDCGIAIGDSNLVRQAALHNDWLQSNIQPLHYSIAPREEVTTP